MRGASSSPATTYGAKRRICGKVVPLGKLSAVRCQLSAYDVQPLRDSAPHSRAGFASAIRRWTGRSPEAAHAETQPRRAKFSKHRSSSRRSRLFAVLPPDLRPLFSHFPG